MNSVSFGLMSSDKVKTALNAAITWLACKGVHYFILWMLVDEPFIIQVGSTILATVVTFSIAMFTVSYFQVINSEGPTVKGTNKDGTVDIEMTVYPKSVRGIRYMARMIAMEAVNSGKVTDINLKLSSSKLVELFAGMDGDAGNEAFEAMCKEMNDFNIHVHFSFPIATTVSERILVTSFRKHGISKNLVSFNESELSDLRPGTVDMIKHHAKIVGSDTSSQ